jgi:beta-lactamase regulating signal transducer with metallopeptidase domain
MLAQLFALPALSDSFAAALADAALRAAALLLLAAFVTLAWRGASAAARHLVWTGALAGALVMPLLTAWVPGLPVAHFPDTRTLWAPPSEVVAAPAPDESALPHGGEVSSAEQGGTSEAAVTIAPMVDGGVAAPRAGAATEARVDMPATATSASGGSERIPMLVAIWAVGAMLVLVPVILGRVRVLLLARHARPVLGAPWAAVAGNVLARFPGAARVRLLESDDATMPMTWGVLHPVVLLPTAADAWTERQRRDVLLHELAHVRRRDCLTQLVAQLACAVHWFNPLVWVAARRLQVEREHACDDSVLAAGARPSDYATHLLEVARTMRVGSVAPLGAVAMARRAQLSERLLAVLDARRRRDQLTARVAVPATAIVAAVVLLVSAFEPARADARSIGDALVLSEDPAYEEKVKPRRTAPAAPQEKRRPTERRDTRHDARAQASLDFIASTLMPEAPRPSPCCRETASSSTSSAVAQGGDGDSISGDSIVIDADAKVARAYGSAQSGCSSTKSMSHTSNTNKSDDGTKRSMKVTWSGDGCSFSFESEGKITVAQDFSDISAVSDGGWVEITERTGGTVRRYDVRSRGGSLERRYTVDGERRELDAQAQRWIAATLLEIERRTAAFAPTRVSAIFESGGANAVLAEIGRLGSDYARRVYFGELFKQGTEFDDAFLARATSQMARTVEGDYELRVILGTVAGARHFGDAASTAYADALRSMESDYERRESINALFRKRERLPSSVVRTVLASTKDMESDYEQRVVLTALLGRPDFDGAMADAALDAVNGMSSDYERRVVLGKLLARKDLNDASLAKGFRAVRAMSSDYEKRVVLSAAVRGRQLSGEALEAFEIATASIDSEYERGQVLTAAGRRSDRRSTVSY